MSLCKTCRKFDLQDFQNAPDGGFPRRYTEVQAAAAAGCEFCTFLHATADEYAAKLGLAQDAGLWVRLSIGGKYDTISKRILNCNRLHVYVSDSMLASSTERVNDIKAAPDEICIAADQGSPAYRSGVVSGRYLGIARDSVYQFSAIKEWIEGCLSQHGPHCRSTVSGTAEINPRNSELPSRCIDVSSTKIICLRECNGLRGAYITLSHRWGPAVEACKTTPENYQARLNGRGFYDLSGSIQDAISVAQGLGIAYVWIDSLCIIQNDAVDWNKESVRMASYYQNSIFTIAAECKSQEDGFLSAQRERPFKKLLQLPYLENGIQNGNIYIYRRRWRSDRQYLAEVDRSELMSRGWVFQEWFLSRRIVHYAPTEIYLECQSKGPMSICNDIVTPTPERSGFRHKPDNITRADIAFRLGFKSRFSVSSAERTAKLRAWYDLITAYSRMKLSYPEKDHLVAVSGIATEFNNIVAADIAPQDGKLKQGDRSLLNNPQYISGLWLSDIHYGLLWKAASASAKPCTCGAPSWSWASLDGPVNWFPRHFRVEKHCKVVPVSSGSIRSASNADSDGVVTSLRVTGKLQQVVVCGQLEPDLANIIAMKTHDPVPKRDDDSQEYAYFSEQETQASNRRLICQPQSLETAGGWGLFERPDLLQQSPRGAGTIITLALAIVTRKQVGLGLQASPGFFTFGHDVIDVLFVEPVEEGVGKFRRIGMGSLFEKDMLYGFTKAEELEINLV